MHFKSDNRSCRGFSLVEVVLCLGVVSFCLVALLGLFATGISLSRNSVQSVRAAHVMSRVLAQRVAQPVGTVGADGGALAMPPFVAASDSLASGAPVYLGLNGEVVPTASEAAFQLNFRVKLSSVAETDTAVGRMSRVWAVLSWPAGAQPGKSAGSYEITYCYIMP